MSVFRDALMFLDGVGVYDVVLPLLLIFSIVYAILEKTKVFGTEKVKDKTVTRKNVNAMVAFVAAFFVVASAQLVGTIHRLVADVSLVLVTFVMFMILIGVFHKDGEIELSARWKGVFMFISFTSLALILMNALGWLEPTWYFLVMHWDSSMVASIFLLAIMVGFIVYVTRDQKKSKSEE